MARRFLITTVAELQALPANPEGRRLKGRLLHLGKPVVERAGVVNRRVAWGHDFPDEWPSGMRSIEFDDDTAFDANLVDQFPANWRFRVIVNPEDSVL